MTYALEEHQGTVSIGGKTITNFRFVDDIDGLAGKEEELASLVDRLDKTSAAFGMEISAEKTRLMTNYANGISIDIRMNGEKLARLIASSIWVQSSQIKVPSLSTVQNFTDNSGTREIEDHLERKAYISKLKDQTNALP